MNTQETELAKTSHKIYLTGSSVQFEADDFETFGSPSKKQNYHDCLMLIEKVIRLGQVKRHKRSVLDEIISVETVDLCCQIIDLLEKMQDLDLEILVRASVCLNLKRLTDSVSNSKLIQYVLRLARLYEKFRLEQP